MTQFPVQDVTKQHMQSFHDVIELIQYITGANYAIMGAQSPRGRKTATEVRTSSTYGVNRLKTTAEYNSALGWGPLAQVLVQNTQQYMDVELKVKIVGDLLQSAGQFINVDPEGIQGDYDFTAVDGTMPIDRMAQANLWKEILIGLHQSPGIALQYDLGKIFDWMAQLAGLKNINKFKLMPDQAVLAQAQAGNLVPASGGKPNGAGTPEMQGMVPPPGGAYGA